MVRTPNLDVHVHICNLGSDWERRYLLFRDWLRYDEKDRILCGDLKKNLSKIDWSDTNAYAQEKTSAIQEITQRANEWAISFGWERNVMKKAKKCFS